MTVANSMFSVSGKAVLVTGGTSGIGLMIARGFVEAGARVYVSSRKADNVAATASELSEIGTCIGIPADVSTEEGVTTLAAGVGEHEDALHVLINNAGATWGGTLEDYPASGFDKVMTLNVRGPFALTQACLGLLRRGASADDPARIINTTSVEATLVPQWENYAYPASKAALNQLTRHLARNLAREHITVNAIAPGPFPSKMIAFALESDEGLERVEATVPLGRVGRPDDAAGVAIFLSSRAGSYLTGAVLPLDGGLAGVGRMDPDYDFAE